MRHFISYLEGDLQVHWEISSNALPEKEGEKFPLANQWANCQVVLLM
jgi:hypothetical protein